MSPLLLTGIVLTALPVSLIFGFAAYIFLGFVNDDPDARAVLNLALIVMGIGIALIVAYVVGSTVAA